MASHQFAAALATGQAWAKVQPARSSGLWLQGDAALELGQYAEAARLFAEAGKIDDEVTLNGLTRRARLDHVHGRLEAAAQNFQRALALAQESSLTGDFPAWCHVQLGELAFRQGQWDEAEKCYRAAGQEMPGWYVVEEHLAELLGARGKFDESAAAYEKVIARVPRAELCQALGDLLVFAGQPEAAKPWFARARETYERSVAAGSLLYLHHGSGFFADSLAEPALAIEWARKDLAQRKTYQAWDALAWALYKGGQHAEAAQAITHALATGARDAHILYHASMIRLSAGHVAEGRKALQAAIAVNPRYNSVHAHR
jgi:tetratricopeptide (TPR) repeat protein